MLVQQALLNDMMSLLVIIVLELQISSLKINYLPLISSPISKIQSQALRSI